METRLIMLPTPILCNDENIIAGDKVFMITNNLLGKYGDIITIISTRESHTEIIRADGNPHWFACEVNYQREKTYKKIIAGVEDIPTVDLSNIEKMLGLIDIEKIVKNEMGLPDYLPVESMSPTTSGSFDFGVECFKRGLEFNGKKFSESNMIDFHNFIFRHPNQNLNMGEYLEQYKQSMRPDEYIVETKQECNKIKVIEIVKQCN